MGQLSGYSPVQLMQLILQLTCNLATVKVSDIRGVCTIYIRYLSVKFLSSKISALVLLPFQVAHSCSLEECVPFSQWYYFLLQRNPVINGPKEGSRWVMLGVLNHLPKYNFESALTVNSILYQLPQSQWGSGFWAHCLDPSVQSMSSYRQKILIVSPKEMALLFPCHLSQFSRVVTSFCPPLNWVTTCAALLKPLVYGHPACHWGENPCCSG